MDYVELVFKICEMVGTVAFAVSGAMVAIDKKADLFGVIFIAVITAFGGGLTRDIIIGVTPPTVFRSAPYVLSAMGSALAVFIIARILKDRYVKSEIKIEHINNFFDAVGLGVFAVMGARNTIIEGFDGSFLIITMGMLTAIGGGLIRDMILGEIPFVLKKKIYALAAIFGASAYLIMNRCGVDDTVSMTVGVISTFALRMLATMFKWRLPRAID